MNNSIPKSNIRYFDLRLDNYEGGATVNVTNSPAGQSSSAFPTVFSLELRRSQFEELSMVDQVAVGSRLWDSLFAHAEIAELWRAGSSAGSLGMRLTIDGAELAALPWELLYDPRLARFVALDAQAALIRFLPLPFSASPVSTDRPLRVLFTGCSPDGLPRLDVEREQRLLQETLPEREMTLVGGRQPCSMSRLASELIQGVAIWHFAGHGAEGVLIFDDGAGNPVSVDAFTLGTLLTGAGVRVAVVNACRAGAGGGTASSIAGALLRAGVPVVVAMQAEISDTAAIAFCQSLYHAIFAGYSVEYATTAGRRAVFALGEPAGAGWWMPALYSRSDAPVVLVDSQAMAYDNVATHGAAAPVTVASGGSAISQGGIAVSGHVGGSVVVVTTSKP